jgi:hypothetical protein
MENGENLHENTETKQIHVESRKMKRLKRFINENGLINGVLCNRWLLYVIKKKYKIGMSEIELLLLVRKLTANGASHCLVNDMKVFLTGGTKYSILKFLAGLIDKGFLIDKGKGKRGKKRLISLNESGFEATDYILFTMQKRINQMHDNFELRKFNQGQPRKRKKERALVVCNIEGMNK